MPSVRCPFRLAFTQRRQRIDRLAALADREHERVFVHRHVAVPEFASELDLSRNMGETFDQTFAYPALRGERFRRRLERSDPHPAVPATTY